MIKLTDTAKYVLLKNVLSVNDVAILSTRPPTRLSKYATTAQNERTEC